MKKIFFVLLLSLFLSQSAFAIVKFNPFTGKQDFTGVSVSADMTVPCPSGQIMKSSGGGTWACGTDSTSAGGGNSVYVSEETVAVYNNATADMIFNVAAGFDWTGAGQNRTLNIDTQEISRDKTWSDGGSGEMTWTMNLSAGDPTITFKNARTNFSGDISASSDVHILGDNIEATTETDRFVWMANGSTYAPEAIDLGTDTTGNYAASNAEAGDATGIAANTVVAADIANGDHGDFTYSGNVANLDADVVSNDEIAPQAVSTDQLQAIDVPADEECYTYESNGRGEWQSCGSGGGDSITVNSSAATDPDFLNGDIDWTLTGGNSITATVGCTNCIAGTEIALGSDAQGDVMYYDGTDWVRLAKGTAGQVLEMNAGATAPEWDTDDSGGSSTFNWVIAPQTAKLPLVNPAQIDGGKPGWRLLYDASTPERVSFDTVIIPYAGGNVSADIQYTMTSATSGGIAIAIFGECTTPGDSTEVDGNSFGSINSGIQTVPGTAGRLSQMGVGLGNPDSCSQGDRFRIMVSRDTTSSDDTATGDLEIRAIRVYEV